ncbi:MAG TPA: cyclic-di-AMP receptor [Chloroflexota bacterium]|jgi:uncharacterized protein YaaQ
MPDAVVTPQSAQPVATKLVVAIVQDEDAPALSDAVVGRGYRVTRMHTVGGFLRKGNATILVGVQERQIAELLAIIRQTCRTRMAFLTATYPVEMAEPFLSEPIEVQVGGAVVFILDVERFEPF